MKFNIGGIEREIVEGIKLRIRDDLVIENEYNDYFFIEEMEDYLGQIVTVLDTNFVDSSFSVEEDYTSDGFDGYRFTPEMVDWTWSEEPEQPKRQRGFEKVSLEQFLIDGFSTERFSGDDSAYVWTHIYDELKLPKRGTKHSAGYDVFAPFGITLHPNETIKIPTGIKAYMMHDEVMYGHIRSSKGFKYALRLMNTTAIGDSDYYDNESNEGHYWLKIRNEGDKTIHIEKGEAFAQFVFHKYLITDDDDFENGEERQGGIGSTDER